MRSKKLQLVFSEFTEQIAIVLEDEMKGNLQFKPTTGQHDALGETAVQGGGEGGEALGSIVHVMPQSVRRWVVV